MQEIDLHTVLLCGIHVDNIAFPAAGIKVITGNFAAVAKVTYVALYNISRCAKLIFNDPERFIGKNINLIGDLKWRKEIAALFSAHKSKVYRYKAASIIRQLYFQPVIYRLRRLRKKWNINFKRQILHGNIAISAKFFGKLSTV